MVVRVTQGQPGEEFLGQSRWGRLDRCPTHTSQGPWHHSTQELQVYCPHSPECLLPSVKPFSGIWKGSSRSGP